MINPKTFGTVLLAVIVIVASAFAANYGVWSGPLLLGTLSPLFDGYF